MQSFGRIVLAIAIVGGLTMTSLSAPAVSAEEKEVFTLEEVVITASKRETQLQDTALAVSAYTKDMLDDLNINDSSDFEALAPSFTNTPSRISIRGVGRFSEEVGTSPGVGLYTDGVFSEHLTALNSNPINLERVEILRGPQGTLYGRNTTGGAVNVVTKRPTDEFHVDLRAKFGNYGHQQFAGVVSGPILDALGFKLYIDDIKRDGLVENVAGEDLNSRNQTTVEGQLELDVTDDLSLWVKHVWTEYDQVPGGGRTESPIDCSMFSFGPAVRPSFLECFANGSPATLYQIEQDNPYMTSQNTPGYVKLEDVAFTTFKATYDFEAMSLSYLFARNTFDYNRLTDMDDTANEQFSVLDFFMQDQTQITHELQLTSYWDKNWRFLLGAFHFSNENEQRRKIGGDPAKGEALAAPFTLITSYADAMAIGASLGAGGGIPDTVTFWENPELLSFYQRGLLDNTSWAVFGELEFDFTEQWSLNLGLRYSYDDFDGGEARIVYGDPSLIFGTFPNPPLGFPLAVDLNAVGQPGCPTCGGTSGVGVVGPDTRIRYVDSIDVEHDRDFSNVTGHLTLNYRPYEGQLLWAKIATGYKMGGVQLGLTQIFQGGGGLTDGFFDQEDMAMAELGWKASLLEDRLRTEVVGFFSKYDDMQQMISSVVPGTEIRFEETTNIDTEMYGLEVSTAFLVTENLRAMYAGSYNYSEIVEDAFYRNTTYGQFDPVAGDYIAENVKGNHLAITPRYKHALSLHYSLPTDIGRFSLGGTFSYIGKRYFSFDNYNSEDSYTRLDAQASWTSMSERYRILAAAKNATDELVYNTYGCNNTGVPGSLATCGGGLMNQRLVTVEFMVRF